jgi:hypothetical protein
MERKPDKTRLMSVGGETAPERGKRGDDVCWADVNLTGAKKEKINAINSAGINEW